MNRLLAEEKSPAFKQLSAYLQYITREVFHLSHEAHEQAWVNEGIVAVQATDEGVWVQFPNNNRAEIESGGRFPVHAMTANYGFNRQWRAESKNVFAEDQITSGIEGGNVPCPDQKLHSMMSREGGIGKNWTNSYLIKGRVDEILKEVREKDPEGFDAALKLAEKKKTAAATK